MGVWICQKNLKRAVGLVLILAMVGGCALEQGRKYKPNPPEPNVKTTGLKVAVVELEDNNPSTAADPRAGALVMIPGVLWATTEIYHPTAFGNCVANELRASRLFVAVDYYPTWEKLQNSFADYDLLVTGRLRQDHGKSTMTTYGMGPLGMLFLFMGVPGGFGSREADFEVEAYQPIRPEKVLWRERVNFESSNVFSIFYHGNPSNWDIAEVVSDRLTLEHYYTPRRSSTDFCPTEVLQPKFLQMRQSLAKAIADGGEIHSALLRGRPESGEGMKP